MSFEEFLSIFLEEKKNAKKVSVEEFIDTLSAFDKDNAGKVSSGELRHVLTLLGEYESGWLMPDTLSGPREQIVA